MNGGIEQPEPPETGNQREAGHDREELRMPGGLLEQRGRSQEQRQYADVGVQLYEVPGSPVKRLGAAEEAREEEADHVGRREVEEVGPRPDQPARPNRFADQFIGGDVLYATQAQA